MTNVIIRAYEPEDVNDVAELFSMPMAQRGTLQLPYPSRSRVKERFEQNTDNMYRLVAVVEDSQKVVGVIGLFQVKTPRRAHVGQIGMAVHDDYANQGVGSKLMEAVINLADNWLNLKRLELTVFTDNEPAIHLYKKWGFHVEGTHHKYAFRDGRYVDTYAMARVSN